MKAWLESFNTATTIQEQRKFRIFLNSWFYIIIFLVVMHLARLYMGVLPVVSGTITAFGTLLIFFIPWVLKKTQNIFLCFNIVSILVYLMIFFRAQDTGLIRSSTIIFITLTPILCSYFLTKKQIYFHLLLAVSFIVAILIQSKMMFPDFVNKDMHRALNYILITLFVSQISSFVEVEKNRHDKLLKEMKKNEIISHERGRADVLATSLANEIHWPVKTLEVLSNELSIIENLQTSRLDILLNEISLTCYQISCILKSVKAYSEHFERHDLREVDMSEIVDKVSFELTSLFKAHQVGLIIKQDDSYKRIELSPRLLHLGLTLLLIFLVESIALAVNKEIELVLTSIGQNRYIDIYLKSKLPSHKIHELTLINSTNEFSKDRIGLSLKLLSSFIKFNHGRFNFDPNRPDLIQICFLEIDKPQKVI